MWLRRLICCCCCCCLLYYWLFYVHVSVLQLGMRPQLSCVLQEAFDFVHTELQTVQQGHRPGSSSPSGQLEDYRTMSLLEKYSELLVQMTQKKLNKIWSTTKDLCVRVCTEAEKGQNLLKGQAVWWSAAVSSAQQLTDFKTSVLILKAPYVCFYGRKLFDLCF